MSATAAPQPTLDTPEARCAQSPQNDSQTLSEAPSAPQTVYRYSRDGIHVILPDGRFTRPYTSHDAARRAVERGAVFTATDYERYLKRLPEWKD